VLRCLLRRSTAQLQCLLRAERPRSLQHQASKGADAVSARRMACASLCRDKALHLNLWAVPDTGDDVVRGGQVNDKRPASLQCYHLELLFDGNVDVQIWTEVRISRRTEASLAFA